MKMENKSRMKVFVDREFRKGSAFPGMEGRGYGKRRNERIFCII